MSILGEVRAMTDPWRLRCPEGHASLRHPHTKDGYYCERCRRLYEGEPIDAKAVDGFPVEVSADV